MLKEVATILELHTSISGFLLGYLSSRVESFLRGVIDQERLADDAAFLELLRTLAARRTPQELRDIASGAKELPGGDVHSVQ